MKKYGLSSLVQKQESQGPLHIVDEKNGEEDAIGPVVETLDNACEEQRGQRGQLPHCIGCSSWQLRGRKDM